MVDYNLIKFSGDKELDGKATAIISWEGKYDENEMHKEVVESLSDMRMAGILDTETEFNSETNRWVMTVKTVTTDVLITVDKTQQKIVILADNANVLTLFRIVECILNAKFDKSITYRIQKLCSCLVATVNKRYFVKG